MRIPRFIHRFLNRIGPYQALLILAVPLAIVEPLKLVALFVVGGGHFIAGLLIMICAYTGSLFITERLFVVLKPKLLTLPWFAVAWQWFVTVRDKLIYWLRRTWTRLRRNVRRVPAGTLKPVSALVGKRNATSPTARCWLVGTDTLSVENRAMPNNQVNVTELNGGESATAPLLLLRLVRDLEVLGDELWTAEETIGQPVWTYQDPLAERLRRVGVSEQKVEDFSAWTRTISSLISDDSRDENQLAKIVAAEAVGLKLLAALVASLKKSKSHQETALSEAVAA
jgi:hypothetical protein